MKRTHGRYGAPVLIGALLLFSLACLTSGDFAALALQSAALPAMRALHRLTAPVPFPVSEPLTFAIGVILLYTLAAAALRAVRDHEIGPLLSWLRGAAGTALALISALALLWLPACGARARDLPPTPDAGQLAWLCGELVDALNDGLPAFPAPGDSLREAPSVAGMPGCAVKAARFPEWMRRSSISGLFVPLTGEALADAAAPAALAPFTAVHELMHLAGIADEGEANIAAWERCQAAGGAFEASARLWALRYALGLLREADADAWRDCRQKMKDPLAQVFEAVGGEATPGGQAAPVAALLRFSRGDYTSVVGYLVDQADMA